MKTGIALSGGGTRGFAHLGVLAALEEAGVRADIISGTSAGSIVAAFIAAGKKPRETAELVKKYKMTDYAKVAAPSAGILTLGSFAKILKQLIPAKTFEELEIPLITAAVNLYTGRLEYFKSGPLVPAIEASCSIPVLFSPVKIGDQLYVDGGLLDNLPYAPLKGRCDRIIAVNVAASGEVKRVGNLLGAVIRINDIIANRDMEKARLECDLYIQPAGIEEYKILDMRQAEELFKLGYEYCKNNVNLKRFLV